MPGSQPKRPATYDDLRRVPEELVAEIIDGELVTSPRPGARHTAATSALGSELVVAFGRKDHGGPGGWVILDEPELHVVEQVLVPDLAGWRRERMPEIPDVAYFELAPDWICEVLSPSTAARDRTRKVHYYAQAGVTHLWFIDPALETLEVLRHDGGGWRLMTTACGNTVVRAAPFDEAPIDLAVLWAR